MRAEPGRETSGSAGGGSSHGWLEVGAVAAGTFGLVTTEFLPVGLLTNIAADFRVSDGVAGYMVTIPGAIAALSAPSLILLAKKLERRLVLLLLTSMIIVSNAIVVAAPSYGFALAARAILGVAVGGAWTFGVPIGRRLVAQHHAHRATAVIIAAISVATVVGVPVGTLIGNAFGWRAAFGATGTFALLALAAQAVLLRRLPAEKAIGLRDVVAISRIPAGRAGLVAIALLVAGHFAAFTYLTPFLKEMASASDETVAFALLIYGIAGLIGTIIAERAVARNVFHSYVGVGFVLGVTLLATVMMQHHAVAAILLTAIWGAAFGAVPVVAQVWMHDASPELFEGGSALFVATFQIAIGIGSLIGGLVVDCSGVDGALLAGGVLAVTSAGSLLWYSTWSRALVPGK